MDFHSSCQTCYRRAIGDQNRGSRQLLARTVRAKVNFPQTMQTLVAEAQQKYQKMLDDNEAVLKGVSEALQKRLAEWAHPAATLRVAWQQDSSKAVRVDPPLAGVIAGESGYEGSLVRFGHGFQRSYLLALLPGLATSDDKAAPTLILGCGARTISTPPAERHLAGVFETLSQGNAPDHQLQPTARTSSVGRISKVSDW